MTSDREIDERILAAIPVVEPSADFTDDVVAAIPARPRRLQWAAVAVVALAAGAVFAWSRLQQRRDLAGGRQTSAIETVSLGRRGVVVAQPATELEWWVRRSGDAVVAQRRGNAFYRVEPGGPFEVTTPAGKVLVKGTCFSVEMDPRHQVIAPGSTLVTVYEGRVRVETDAGTLELTAGDTALLRPHESPATVALADAPAAPNEEVALLRGKVKALERRLAGLKTYGDDENAPHDPPFFGLTNQELRELAARCEIRLDVPPFALKPGTLSDEDANRLGVSDSERASYDRIVATASGRFISEVRALYRELTGEEPGGLELRILEAEIDSKSSEDDHNEAIRQLTQERAGLLPPRADVRKASVYERYLRLTMRSGDDLERELARELGAAKARSLRGLDGGWVLDGKCNP